MKDFKPFLIESRLSRVFEQIKNHDCGFITAFRGMNTKKINIAANKKLLTQLKSKDFGVTSVKGSYIEYYDTDKANEFSENSFFVVDLGDCGDLKNILSALGAEYDHDSVLFVPKGGQEGHLIGTNASGWPGLGNINKFKNPVFVAKGEFMTHVNGRPFIFKEEFEPALKYKYSVGEKRSLVEQAKQPIEYFLE